MKDTNKAIKHMFFLYPIALPLFLLVYLCFPIPAIAVENRETVVAFTESVADKQAERLAASLCPDRKLTATEPIGYFDVNGNFSGCIIRYKDSEGVASGYVIYDVSDGLQLVEFSLSKNAISPYDQLQVEAVKENVARGSSYDLDTIYEIAPLTFCCVEKGLRTALDSDGNTYELPPEMVAFTGKKPSWDDVFVKIANYLNDNYEILDTSDLEVFFSWKKSDITMKTKKYCCGVSAMLAIVHYYCHSCRFEKLPSIYNELWTRGNVAVDYVSGGVTYGIIDNNKMGPTVVSFCNKRATRLFSNFQNSPSYGTFINSIYQGNMPIFCGGIISAQNGKRSGHAMAVEGHCLIREKSSGKVLRALLVYDGWNSGAAFVNFDFTKFTDTHGIFFWK